VSRRPRRKGGTLKDSERRQLARASRHAAAPPAQPARSDLPLVLCDGGSRGNPGPAAAAAVLLGPQGDVVDRRVEPIGHATAGEAEYRAILLGLELAAEHGWERIELRSDSQLAIAGASDVPEIRAAAERFAAVRFRWHGRAANEAADALVRELLWPSR
jgi:ribonuclease HI